MTGEINKNQSSIGRDKSEDKCTDIQCNSCWRTSLLCGHADASSPSHRRASMRRTPIEHSSPFDIVSPHSSICALVLLDGSVPLSCPKKKQREAEWTRETLPRAHTQTFNGRPPRCWKVKTETLRTAALPSVLLTWSLCPSRAVFFMLQIYVWAVHGSLSLSRLT